MEKEFNQKQIEDYSNFLRRNRDFETGWTREERFILNKIRMEYLEKDALFYQFVSSTILG